MDKQKIYIDILSQARNRVLTERLISDIAKTLADIDVMPEEEKKVLEAELIAKEIAELQEEKEKAQEVITAVNEKLLKLRPIEIKK